MAKKKTASDESQTCSTWDEHQAASDLRNTGSSWRRGWEPWLREIGRGVLAGWGRRGDAERSRLTSSRAKGERRL